MSDILYNSYFTMAVQTFACMRILIEFVRHEKVFKKLGKSIVAYKDISKGEKFTLDNLSGKIFNETYIPVRESNLVIGKYSNSSIKKGSPILSCYLN